MKELDYSYKILISTNTLSYTWNTLDVDNKEPNGVEISINKDITNNFGTLDLTIKNIDLEIANSFEIFNNSSNCKGVYYNVEVSLGFANDFAMVFTGMVIECNVENNNNLINLSIKANGIPYRQTTTGYNFYFKRNKATHKQLKQEVAKQLGNVELVSDIPTDSGKIVEPFIYQGNNLMAYLQLYYSDQNILLTDKKLIFKKREEKDTYLTNGNAYLLEDQLISNVTPVSQLEVEFTFLLSPNVEIFDLIQLKQSDNVNSRYNGVYKVMALDHQATIDKRTGCDGSTKVRAMRG